MNLTKVKRIIGQCRDTAALKKLKDYISERVTAIDLDRHDRFVGSVWSQISHLKKGDVVYAHKQVLRSGFERFLKSGRRYVAIKTNFLETWGKQITIEWIRPRKREVFVSIGSSIIRLQLDTNQYVNLMDIDLRPDPCPEALTDALGVDHTAVGDGRVIGSVK